MPAKEQQYAYLFVAANDGRVVAVAGDDGDLDALSDFIAEVGLRKGYIVREPVERARGMLFETYPGHDQ